MMNKEHIGTKLDDYLEEEGIEVKFTNEMWLKSLSTEELADFIMMKLHLSQCQMCATHEENLMCNHYCFKNIVDWLKQEVCGED